MAEPEEVVAALPGLFAEKDFAGQHVLVSAGPTREYLDPVRFISNPSSGKMGYAVAAAALDRGAEVTLVTGPSQVTPPMGATVEQVESAEEMLGSLAKVLCRNLSPNDERRCSRLASGGGSYVEKQAKMGETQTLSLVRTPDILSELAKERGKQLMVGFAMETHQGVERAADKARRKGLEFICLNYPTNASKPLLAATTTRSRW